MAGCSVAKKTDEALYEVTEQVSERDTVTGKRTVSLADRKAQIEQGNAAAKQTLAEMREQGIALNEAASPAHYERMQTIFNRVHSVSHLRTEDWTTVLTSSEQFNAFVTGGTYMVVHLGLMKALEDDQVAAVFGHELAHVAANHVGERMGHAQLAAIAGGDAAKEEGFAAAFGHDQEAEADRIGTLYAALAGYSPHAAASVWQEMFKKIGNARGASVYSSHPVNSERAASNQQIAEKLDEYYTPGQINPDFERLLKDNVLYTTRSKTYEDQAGEGGGLAAALETAANAVARHRQAKAEKRRQERHAEFVRAVNSLVEIVGYRAREAHAWEIGLRYRGNVPLQWMTVHAQLPSSSGTRLSFVEKVEGPIRPGATFAVVFRDEELPAQHLAPKHGRFVVDDAKPAQ